MTAIGQMGGADHEGNHREAGEGAEIVNDAVREEPDTKHGDGKNDDADED
ncbi:hypothetical protein J6524_04765 [Bradyrhizobium sp. WSM 1738]|nr:hypothetical protein [Bradyrhizobium hereditatis]MCA6114241.1 hypothetical protein [Bradyrhizobium hereditatis]